MKSQLKEEYVIENIVVGQIIVEEDTPLDTIVKLNLKIDVIIKRKQSNPKYVSWTIIK